jgi:uncharacterized protein
MFPDISQGAWSAFLAGLLVSPHCVGMCGPLYCSLAPIRKTGGESLQLAYHFGRVLAYVLIGILAGSLSLNFFRMFQWDASRYLPWALVALLLAFAVGLDKLLRFKRVPQPKFVSRWLLKSRHLAT